MAKITMGFDVSLHASLLPYPPPYTSITRHGIERIFYYNNVTIVIMHFAHAQNMLTVVMLVHVCIIALYA